VLGQHRHEREHFSYAGKVTVGFLTDAGLVPEPQALADAARTEALRLGRVARTAPYS
jgi:hypothetical protein